MSQIARPWPRIAHTLLVSAIVLSAIATETLGQLNQTAKFKQITPIMGDDFGASSDISGSTVIVGAPHDSTGQSQSGSAYIFEFNTVSGVWQQIARLRAPTPRFGDTVGNDVAISGNVAVSNANASAYVFERNAVGAWVFRTQLAIPGASPTTSPFQTTVAVSGDTIVVGASTRNGLFASSGAAYIFKRDAVGNWPLAATLVSPEAEFVGQFGFDVAIRGDTVAIAAIGEDGFVPNDDAGNVHVFRRGATGSWTVVATLLPDSGPVGPGDVAEFGTSVAIDASEHSIIVGDIEDAVGSAYIFRESPVGAWQKVARLRPPTSPPFPYGFYGFGSRVAIEDDVALVGAPAHGLAPNGTEVFSGAIYVARETSSGAWQLVSAPSTVNDPGPGEQLGGLGLAIDGGRVVATTILDGEFAPPVYGTGSTYVFEVQPIGNTPAGENVQVTPIDASTGDAPATITLTQVTQAGETSIASSDVGPPPPPTFQLVGAPPVFYEIATTAVYVAPIQVCIDYTNLNIPAVQESLLALHHFEGGSWVNITTSLNTTTNVICGEVTSLSPFAIFAYVPPDQDGDGILDAIDNCVSIPNTDQADFDGDQSGNACDDDDDGDGLLDAVEAMLGTNPLDPDSDDDGLLDGAEAGSCHSPLDADSDDDDLGDALELSLGTLPCDSDTDNDALADGLEHAMSAAGSCVNPLTADSDGDDLPDGIEVNAGWDPCDNDSDGDGLSDGDEANLYHTNPLEADSDLDGLTDSTEVGLAAGGTCPSPTDGDSDDDGILDGDELTLGGGPCDTDSDDDGLADGNEAAHGTSVSDPDSDDDGLLDGAEVDIALGSGCPSPTTVDSDGDTLADGAETTAGTSACNSDTDGDGLDDAVDPNPLIPQVTPAILSAMTFAVAGEIFDTQPSEFLGPNLIARKARRAEMTVLTALAAVKIQCGQFAAARALLTIVERRTDGASPPPDWMAAGGARTMIHNDLETILTLLDLLD